MFRYLSNTDGDLYTSRNSPDKTCSSDSRVMDDIGFSSRTFNHTTLFIKLNLLYTQFKNINRCAKMKISYLQRLCQKSLKTLSVTCSECHDHL